MLSTEFGNTKQTMRAGFNKRSFVGIVARRTPQIRAVLSTDAVTTRVPSGLNAADLTSSSCPRRTLISFPVIASQIRAVLSADAVTMRFPPGLKAAEVIQETCPRRTAISL